MAKISRRKHQRFFVERFGGRNRSVLRGEVHRLGESFADQVSEHSAAIPTFKRRPAKIDVVDLDAFVDHVFAQARKKRILGLQLVVRGVNQIDAENADGFLLQDVRIVAHINVQQHVVRRTAGLHLEAETDPAVRVVRAGIVARRDGIDKREEARMCAACVAELREKLSPLFVEHGLKPLPGNVARTGAVQIVADFLVVRANRLGHGCRRASHKEEPVRDFLPRADFRERAERGGVQIQRQRFVVRVEFFSGRHA